MNENFKADVLLVDVKYNQSYDFTDKATSKQVSGVSNKITFVLGRQVVEMSVPVEVAKELSEIEERNIRLEFSIVAKNLKPFLKFVSYKVSK